MFFGSSRLGLFDTSPDAAGTAYFFGGYVTTGGGGGSGNTQRTNKIWNYVLSQQTGGLTTMVLQGYYSGVTGFGNTQEGVCAGGDVTDSQGNPVTNTSKIIYSGVYITTTTALPSGKTIGHGASTDVNGYMFSPVISATAPGSSQQILRRVYSTNVWTQLAATTGLATAVRNSAAHNNDTVAHHVGGSTYSGGAWPASTAIQQFTFSTEATMTSVGTLTAGVLMEQVTGNQTNWWRIAGSSGGGTLPVTTVFGNYTFSTVTYTAGTALSFGWRTGDAAGNNAYGVCAGSSTVGSGGSFSTANRWIDYSANTNTSLLNPILTTTIDNTGAHCSAISA